MRAFISGFLLGMVAVLVLLVLVPPPGPCPHVAYVSVSTTKIALPPGGPR